jgi:L-aminopeptidase/D-esterase-like protein
MATGKRKPPPSAGFFSTPQAAALNEIGHAAADCMSRAIIRAILTAGSLGGMTAFCDLKNRQ